MNNALTLHSPPSAELDLLRDEPAFAQAKTAAEYLAGSQLLPQAFRGKPADLFMAMVLAQRMGEDVFTILQNVHFVNGKPGWAAPFLIARANKSGLFEGPLTFETTGQGQDMAVTCSAVLRGGKMVSKTVSLAMARADGWTKNAKYSALPEQMLSYRAATFFIRLYCPTVLYGLHTDDEWEDVAAARGEPIVTTREPEYIEPTVPTRKGRVETLRPASRPAQAQPLGVESDSVAGPSLAASTAPSHRETPTSTGAPAVEVALEELSEGEQIERAATMAALLRIPEARRKAAAERAGCAGRRASQLTLADLRRILLETVEPWEGPAPEGEGLLTQIADLTIDLEPYGQQLRADCGRAAGLPIDQGEPVIDGAPDAMLLRYLSALRGRAAELGVGR